MTPRWRVILFVVVGLAAIAAGTWGLAVGDDSFATWVQFAVGTTLLLSASQAHRIARTSSPS